MKKTRVKIITILIPVSLFMFYLLKDSLFSLLSLLPPCFLYSHFHLYCPACGNTRSLSALLQGDLLKALRYNVVPILVLLIAFAGYIELATYSFGIHRRLLPRRLSVYIVLIILVFLYLLLRNFVPFLSPGLFR
jgi:hypothetical protein